MNENISSYERKNESKSGFLFYTAILLSGVILLLSNNIILHISSLIIVMIICVIKVKLDVMHPYVWFVPFFTLYSIAYPILYLQGSGNYGYSKDSMLLQWVSIFTLVCVVGTKKIKYTTTLIKAYQTTSVSTIIFFVSGAVLLIQAMFISQSQFVNKNDVLQSNNPFIEIGYIFVYIFIIVFALIYSNNLLEGRNSKKILFIACSLVFIAFLFTGERDTILRLILIILLLKNVLYKKLKPISIVVYSVILVPLIPFLSRMKNIATRGGLRENDGTGFINQLLNSEFSSASRNLQVLIVNRSRWDFKLGETLISAVLRPLDYFIPIDTSKFSALRWYQSTFFPGKTTGMGFSTVAEGYLNFGFFGVILWFIIIGIVMRFFYRRSPSNIIFLVIYILLIPIFIYSIRADLANIFSPITKQVLLSILLIIGIERLVKKKVENEN